MSNDVEFGALLTAVNDRLIRVRELVDAQRKLGDLRKPQAKEVLANFEAELGALERIKARLLTPTEVNA